MPTTILDGETYEQARHRRFTEEAKVLEKMQQDEIIRMALEACAPNQTFNSDEEWVKRFAALVAAHEQEPVAWKQTVRALTDQCAALIQERNELQKQVWRYEKHGVTCQTFGHKVESSCAECNENEIYAVPIRTKDLTVDEKVALADRLNLNGRIVVIDAVIAADREKNK